jgi:hypothetical protein
MRKWRYSSIIVDLGNRWMRFVSFTLRLLYLVEKAAGNLRIGDWVGPRAGLEAVEKRKIFSPAGNRTATVQPGPIPIEITDCRQL